MPADLTQARAKLAELKAKEDAATGYADLLEELLELVAGAANEFGTAATADTGTTAGNVPAIAAGGALPVETIPDGLALHSSRATLLSTVSGQEIANAQFVEGMMRWGAFPSGTVFGDVTRNTGGTPISTVVTNILLTTGDVQDYRSFTLRYRLNTPGSQPVVVNIAQPWADGIWRTVNVGGAPTPISYRQLPNEARRLQFRSSVAGYNILSVFGICPDFGYQRSATAWGRGFLYLTVQNPGNTDIAISEDQFLDNAVIEVAGNFSYGSPNHFNLRLPIDGAVAVKNSTNKVLRAARLGQQPGDLFIEVAVGGRDYVARAGNNVIDMSPT